MPEHPDDLERARQLREQASDVRKSARKRAKEAAKEAVDRILADAEKKARMIELAAEAFEGRASSGDDSSLRRNSQHANIRSMKTAHRVHLSAAHASPDDRLATASNKARPPQSVNSLAEAVGVSSTLLRNAHKGTGSIKETVAKRVRDTLGKDDKGAWLFDATVENWPLMRIGK